MTLSAEVLDAVAEGVDVFDNAYVTTVTTGWCAAAGIEWVGWTLTIAVGLAI